MRWEEGRQGINTGSGGERREAVQAAQAGRKYGGTEGRRDGGMEEWKDGRRDVGNGGAASCRVAGAPRAGEHALLLHPPLVLLHLLRLLMRLLLRLRLRLRLHLRRLLLRLLLLVAGRIWRV